MPSHSSSSRKKGSSTYHDHNSRTFVCHCGNRCRWASRQTRLVCRCGAKHRRGPDLRAPSGSETDKAVILRIARNTLWRYRQGIAGRIPPGVRPTEAMLRAIERLDAVKKGGTDR